MRAAVVLSVLVILALQAAAKPASKSKRKHVVGRAAEMAAFAQQAEELLREMAAEQEAVRAQRKHKEDQEHSGSGSERESGSGSGMDRDFGSADKSGSGMDRDFGSADESGSGMDRDFGSADEYGSGMDRDFGSADDGIHNLEKPHQKTHEGIDDEGMSYDHRHAADFVMTGDGVVHKEVRFPVNDDENDIESAIHSMQNKLGSAATDEQLLETVAEAIAKSGLPAPSVRSLHPSGAGIRSAPRDTRMTFTADQGMRWEKNIVIFAFETEDADEVLSAEEQATVRIAQQYIADISCVTFEEYYEGIHTDLGLSHTTYLNYGNLFGCWSYLGPVITGAQPISPCAENGIGIPLHEILHAMASIHEQSRTDRDQWIQLLYVNISPYSLGDFDISSYGSDNSVDYDYGSIMQYSLHSGCAAKVNEPNMNIYDRDLEFLVGQREGAVSFLDRKAININHQCQETKCPSFSIQCQHGGFVGYVEGQCQCVCPLGLMGEDCTELYQPSSQPAAFPSGEYSLPGPFSGCPEDFQEGSRYMSQKWYNWNSGDFKFPAGSFSSTHFDQHFCSSVGSFSHGYDWPAGRYCIFRKGGTCPTGFQQGWIQHDNADDNNANSQSGLLPDGVFDSNTLLYYCCRTDGGETTPIALPRSTPFMLIKYPSATQCQAVQGLEFQGGTISLSDGDEGITAIDGSTPAYDGNFKYYNDIVMHYCYYKPRNYDCGGIVTLSSDNPTATVTSPNYPEPYNMDQECYFLVEGPEDIQLKIQMTDFDVEAAGDKCVDSVEIRHHIISQPGERYCGDYFPKTIVSNHNAAVFVLRSNDAGSNTGFSATVSIITPETEVKYNPDDRGLTYHGNVAYTQAYETCLPWDTVGEKCGYSTFDIGRVGLGLDNYCRNPTGAEQPWCYVNDVNCDTDFCDVSEIGDCYDRVENCESLISGDSDYCQTNGEAFKNCHKSCDFCGFNITEQVPCGVPVTILHATMEGESKSSYSTGESIKYTCDSGFGAQTRYCLTDGTWSGYDRMCGACPGGWNGMGNSCYKFSSNTCSYNTAKSRCEQMDAHLVTFSDAEEEQAVNTMTMSWEYWIGLDRIDKSEYTWIDDTDTGYTNYADGQPGTSWWQTCITSTSSQRKWGATYYNYYNAYVCELDLGDLCSDSRSDCAELLERSPTFCEDKPTFTGAVCRRTCGGCPEGSTDIPIPAAPTPAPTTPAPTTPAPTPAPTSAPSSAAPATDATNPSTCYEGYSSYGGSCYAAVLMIAKNPEAKAHCEAVHAHLVTIADQGEFDFVVSLLGDVGSKKVIIGMSDEDTEGVYTEMDTGNEVTFTKWRSGEPNGGTKQNCVMMQPDSFHYRTFSCNTKGYFVCEYELDEEESHQHIGSEPFASPLQQDSNTVTDRLYIPRPDQGLPTGTLTAFMYYPMKTAKIFPMVLRPGGDGSYTVIDYCSYKPSKSGSLQIQELTDGIEVEEGDVLGFLFLGKNSIAYTENAECSYGRTLMLDANKLNQVTGGGISPEEVGGDQPCRDYHMVGVVDTSSAQKRGAIEQVGLEKVQKKEVKEELAQKLQELIDLLGK